MTEDTVRMNIRNGVYNAKYPKSAIMPPLLHKTLVAMTRDEIALLPAIKDKYDADCKQYEKDCDNRINEFWNDCANAFGVTDNPKRKRLEAIAWDKGHSNGLWSVLDEYQSLVELIL